MIIHMERRTRRVIEYCIRKLEMIEIGKQIMRRRKGRVCSLWIKRSLRKGPFMYFLSSDQLPHPANIIGLPI